MKNQRRRFLKGIEAFPNNRAIQTFYAMTLYNLNEHHKAMELLLTCLIDTTRDEQIINYKNTIAFYANKLTVFLIHGVTFGTRKEMGNWNGLILTILKSANLMVLLIFLLLLRSTSKRMYFFKS